MQPLEHMPPQIENGPYPKRVIETIQYWNQFCFPLAPQRPLTIETRPLKWESFPLRAPNYHWFPVRLVFVLILENYTHKKCELLTQAKRSGLKLIKNTLSKLNKNSIKHFIDVTNNDSETLFCCHSTKITI